jgi:hypothetical protein
LAVETRCKRLTLLIAQKLHGKNDRLVVLIVIELRWLVSVAIEPFALAAKAAENPAAGSRTVTVRIDDPLMFVRVPKVKKASDLNAARFCEALAQRRSSGCWGDISTRDGRAKP